VLQGLEKEAREAKKGLWVDPAAIPPWVYRKTRRGQSLDLSDAVSPTVLETITGGIGKRSNVLAQSSVPTHYHQNFDAFRGSHSFSTRLRFAS
jgi:hypothetical protein